MGAAKRARPARRRRGRACRIRSVDLTIRKWQREERTTTIANWLRPCLFQPPQLCVCGKLATGLCQTSSSIFTLALRDERVQHRGGGGGGAGRSSSSSSRSRNVLCRPTDSPLLANRRLNQWTDPLLKAKSDPRVAFCRKDIRSKLLLQLVRTVTYLRAPIKISAICPAFSHSLWPPPSLHREFADLTALSVSVGLRGPKQLSSQSFGVQHPSRRPESFHIASLQLQQDRWTPPPRHTVLLYAVVEAKRRLSSVHVC
jgi:hypothetical protein